MEHYVGLDVSLRLTAICIVDRTGKIEREGVVASNPEAIAAFVKSHAPQVARIGLETGATSTWLWTELNKMGLPVICIDARHADRRSDAGEHRRCVAKKSHLCRHRRHAEDDQRRRYSARHSNRPAQRHRAGWLQAAGLFAWISARAEQATAEGMDTELALRLTELDPEAWDAGAVVSVLPEIGELEDVDWSRPVTNWPKDMVVRFLLGALPLVRRAMIARDVGGGGVSTQRKSLEEMQRVASGEAGGPLTAPGEMDDACPF